jgi:acetyl-CoA carboxylase biotin carboxylase subunit
MIRKVLIANRGEIAVRIIRACRELGLETVAVYSDVDRTGLHVRRAGEAYRLGPAPSADSYLRIDRIMDVARKSGADAVHPGYGFLAERADFAAAVADAGLAWVGPPPAAIESMGRKVRSRQVMSAAGVPVVPGALRSLDDQDMEGAASELGYPLMIKATEGGGGKGLRRVESPMELRAAVDSARREARKAFGSDEVYLERAIEGARHLEVQVLADAHDHVIHLGERECSMQRRHQKVLEECPSPFATAELRTQMGNAAVAAARAVGYQNAGTVEFLVEPSGSFYFLEMNTRLQVEHPVTEMVTGVDLVKQQLRLAGGRQLRLAQSHISWSGHAIEARINAEDPYNDFLPSTGRIAANLEPTGPGVRVDSSLYEGLEVGLYYDSLLAKLVVWAENRAAAILRLRRALDEYRIAGVKTTIPLHQKTVDTTQFISGNYDTAFLSESFLAQTRQDEAAARAAVIAATVLAHQRHGMVINQLAPAKGPSEWKAFGRRNRMRP